MIHEASSSVILDDNGLKTLDRWDEDWLDVREQEGAWRSPPRFSF